MTDRTMPIIELVEVSASVSGYPILSEASARFFSGEIAVVMGSAGSGKSTLLKVAAGLVVPDSGDVRYFGRSAGAFTKDEEQQFRHRSSFVFQDAALWANTNILSNLTLPMRVHHAWMTESEMEVRARDLLELVGYREKVSLRPAELSIGEQKLVSIARSLVLDPELVFMDDPTSHLDEDSRERVFAILDDLKKRGRAVILVTNNSELAFRHADRLGIVRGGRVPVLGPYDEVVANEEHEFSAIVGRLRVRGARRGAIRHGDTDTA